MTRSRNINAELSKLAIEKEEITKEVLLPQSANYSPNVGRIRKDSKVKFDFWACQRPLTCKWGSGQVYERITRQLGEPDIVFGKTDNIPDGIFFVDKSNGYDWIRLPFSNNQFEFGYWDPPYDRMYKKEGMEIWRTVKRLAILHTFIFPISWLKEAERECMIAVTFGPLKQIRCLQVFRKKDAQSLLLKRGVSYGDLR